MISVVIPTHNAARTLPACFRSLLEATIDGLVSEVIVSDCGSTDATLKIADAAGARVVEANQGRQLITGAQAARKPWLLFLESSSSMEPGWEEETREFIARGGNSAATFRIRLAGAGLRPRLLEGLAAIVARVCRPNVSSNGLLIPARLLNEIYAGSTPADDIGLIRRLNPGRALRIKAAVIASAANR